MRLLIFVAVVVGIALIFGAVYGISAILERKRSGTNRTTTTKTNAPDDDPEFLRNLARRLAEEEAKKQNEAKPQDESDEESNGK
ncbi:MAG: hypothetical protein RL529_342 [Actinomycetota bacterium]|jgi:hypothetical protein